MTVDNIGRNLGRNRGAVQALEHRALHLVALIGQFEADAVAAEIIAPLTAIGCSGLGVELRVEAIVRLGPCVDDGEIGIVEVSNAGAKLEIPTLAIGRASWWERVCQYV